jgi:hypothetical protein
MEKLKREQCVLYCEMHSAPWPMILVILIYSVVTSVQGGLGRMHTLM